METDRFNSIRENAIELFKSQSDGIHTVSLDAIFIALVSDEARDHASAVEKAKEDNVVALPGSKQAPARWFIDTLNAVKGKGEALTVPRFLLYANRFPVKRMDQLNVARWLREFGYTPRKTGGQLVFDL